MARKTDADGRPFVRLAQEVEEFTFTAITIDAAETFTSEELPCLDARNVVLHFILTSFVLEGGEQIDVIVQTTYDGTNWVDIRGVHFSNGDESATYHIVVLVALGTSGAVIEGATLPTLGDDAANAIPPGKAIRYKIVGTDTGPDVVVNCTAVIKR
jgi:hypothetical protein